MSASGAAEGAAGPRRGRRRWFRSLRHVVALVAVLLVVNNFVLPQLAGARRAVDVISDVSVGFAVAGVVLELCAFATYAAATWAILTPAHAPPLHALVRAQLAARAVTNLVPGGAAAGAAVGYRLLTRSGVQPASAGFALGAQALGSAVVLNLLLWAALAVTIPVRGFHPIYGTAALVGTVLLGGFFGLVLALTRGEERAVRVVCRAASRVRWLDGDVISASLRSLAARLRALLADRSLVVRAVGLSFAYWCLAATSLWVFVRAFGDTVPVDGLIVSFGLAYVVGAIPITPGGLGIVEAALIASLVGFGTPRAVAILGVISFRVIEFWLPMPLGFMSYLSLRARWGLPRRAAAEELRELAEESVQDAENPEEWAARHGFRSRDTA